MDIASIFVPENIVLVPIGIGIATFATFIGIGGGLLWAPYLVVIRRLDPQTAVMVSFLIQIAGMGSATVSNIRRKSIYWRLAFTLLPTIGIGILAGALLNRLVPGSRWIEMGLGVLSIVMSLFFTFYTEPYDVRMELDRSIAPPVWLRALSAVFGTISGFFSIGVSDLLIPFIRNKLRVPMHYAIGTKLFLNFALACLGGAVYATLYWDRLSSSMLTILVFSWIGVLIGGQLGPFLSEKIGDEKLKEIFIFALLLIGVHLIYQAL